MNIFAGLLKKCERYKDAAHNNITIDFVLLLDLDPCSNYACANKLDYSCESAQSVVSVFYQMTYWTSRQITNPATTTKAITHQYFFTQSHTPPPSTGSGCGSGSVLVANTCLFLLASEPSSCGVCG